MRAPIIVLLVSVCVLADNNDNRRSKLPFIADALGNTLPPPSKVPATVGSPVNLLTPDRYEFYTFDESGELVKRLMTLEEIQAIVAAGEESEGLVTFANDNKPTIAFNFSQPSYNKVHTVVENVQNVLKAQMEAQKNRIESRPTLDTPDVSDSWSLILPSIFGNTGVDIVPDKSSVSFSTPDTETMDIDNLHESDIGNEIPFSKEGHNQLSTSKQPFEDNQTPPVIEEVTDINSVSDILPIASTKITPVFSTTTTTVKVSSVNNVNKQPTTANSGITTSTNVKTTASILENTTPLTISKVNTTPTLMAADTSKEIKESTTTHTLTTFKPVKETIAPHTTTLTTMKPIKESTKTQPTTTTTINPIKESITTKKTTTTLKPGIGNATKHTTVRKPETTSTTTTTSTTLQPILTTKATDKLSSTADSASKVVANITKGTIEDTISSTDSAYLTKTKIKSTTVLPNKTENAEIEYEKVSTFQPISTFSYIAEKITQNPLKVTQTAATSSSATNILTSDDEKLSSSIAISNYPTSMAPERPFTVSPDYLSTSQFITENQYNVSVPLNVPVIKNEIFNNAEINDEMKEGEPLPPLFDVAQSISQIASDLGNYQPVPTIASLLNSTEFLDLESKENFEIDIPADTKDETNNFIKISTLEPQDNKSDNRTLVNFSQEKNGNKSNSGITTTKTDLPTSQKTTLDKNLTESMDDLLSQVVNQIPQNVSEIEKELLRNEPSKYTKINQTTNENSPMEVISETKMQIGLNPVSMNTTNPSKYSSNQNDIVKSTTSAPELITDISSEKKTDNQKNVHSALGVNYQNVDTKIEIASEKIYDSIKYKNSTNENKNEILKSNYNKTLNDLANVNAQNLNLTKSDEYDKLKTNTSEKYNLNERLSTNKSSSYDFIPKVEEFKKKIQKVNIDDKEFTNERNTSWKLISTVSPPFGNDISNNKSKYDFHNINDNNNHKDIILEFPKENQGLEVTTKDLGEDVQQFTELCNELAFRYWSATAENIDRRRSFVLSPYAITSMLAMIFMGARGATSGEMNEILKLDDMVTFNPHLTLKNISDSIEISSEAGVVVSAFIRELYSDRDKGKVLTFYKERAQQFYNGHVEEANFSLISDIVRRRTNLLVKRYTWGRIAEYMKTNTIAMRPPLAAFSTNIFQTDCSASSVEGRDGEMYFVVSPNVRQRRLVPVPAVVYKKDFLAGYDPVLDATAAALGNTDSIVSTLFLMPGQQGNVVHAEDLEALEKRLLHSNPTTPTWNRILRTLLPRVGLELQIPRFSHKSVFNVSSTLKKMGLKDIFDAGHADLGGVNGPSKDLYLSDMIQSSSFVTCGESVIAEQHHIEEYPENVDVTRRRRTSRWTDWDEPRDYQRAFHDPHDVGDAMHLPLHLRPRQARLPGRDAPPARLKFDRPFLYFVRHNLSGMILYFGRYNPRLLP